MTALIVCCIALYILGAISLWLCMVQMKSARQWLVFIWPGFILIAVSVGLYQYYSQSKGDTQ